MAIGVEVTTSLRSGPSNEGAVSGRFHVAGLTEHGPVDRAELVTSITQFEAIYGGRTAFASNLYDSARLFFEEGGSELVVSRTVGPAATKGSLTLKDASVADTLKVEAANPGPHSAALTVEVVPTGSTVTVTVLQGTTVVGIFRNKTSVASLVAAAADNPHVRITDLGSATAAPGNLPVALPATPLTAGTDDRAAATSTLMVAALGIPGPGTRGAAIAVPGYPASSVGAALIQHAKANHQIALLAPAAGLTPEVAALDAVAMIQDDGAYAGMFYPHLVIPDGSSTRTISPEAYVAAVRARAHLAVGYWKTPAGIDSVPEWFVGTVTTVDRPLNNVLAESRLNGITTIGGVPRLYGWASLAIDQENLGLLSAQDTLNNLSAEVEEALEEFVFDSIDGKGWLLSRISASVIGVLAPIQAANGLYALMNGSTQIDPGYRVRVDKSINPITNLANNEVSVSISVRLSPVAALIQAEIIKVALQAAI